MASKILYKAMDGTPKQMVFADVGGDFNPAAANDLRLATSGERTDVQMTLATIASNAARQGAKADLGEVRARAYAVRGAFELNATPTAGLTIELWWAPSQTSTAANANPGGVSGSDAAYTGYSANLDASLLQLQFIGAFTVTAQATTTIQVIALPGWFNPPERYGTLIVYNRTNVAFFSDDVEMHIVFDPIVDEVQ